MPRRLPRSVSAATPQKLDSPATISSSGTRQSQRPKVTPQKSQYFDHDSAEESDSSLSAPDAAAAEASGYEDEDASLSEPSSAGEEEEPDDYASEESPPPRKKQRRGTKNSGQNKLNVASAKPVKGQELWREGIKTGLGPGNEVVITLPKARLAGKVQYTDDTVHPNTMLFLGDLKENNDREWLKMHDPDFRASLKDFNSFVETVQEKLIELDGTIPELPTKDIIFRIYRDVRFSPDQTPYKTHFSAAWSRTGRKGPFAAYYMQVKPGGSFIGGGLWVPEAPALAALRRDVDRKPHKIKQILVEPNLRKHFFDGISKDEKAAVKAFVSQNAENALKTKPKGYNADHPEIDLIRLRNFVIGRKLTDDEVLGKHGVARITELFGHLVPFITYLNSIVMPDEDDESGSSDDGSGNNGSDAE